MVLADSGEDGLAECESCAYAANLERAERSQLKLEPKNTDQLPQQIATPNKRTIEEVASFLKLKPTNLLKTLIYVADGKPIAVLVQGNRELNEHKLRRALGGVTLQMADDATIEKVTGAPVGFAGPVGLNIPVYADAELQTSRVYAVGANLADTHLINVVLQRDAKITEYYDLVIVREGDLCPRCNSKLREKRGIEVGHVFKLGTKYSKAFDAGYLDAEGNRQIAVMGCYGIGVTRTLQAVIEQSADANGIIWPLNIAPFQVCLVVPNVQHPESMRAAEKLLAELESSGIEVIFDDRDERPGVKFKDADLLGIPIRVVISERSLSEGCAEIKQRSEVEKSMIPIAGAVDHILSIVKGATSI
jgi:prolyl-tRNA synthetase